MNVARNIIRIARHGEALKRVERTGWALAGVSSARSESVGEHSYGTALLSILIAKSLVDNGKSVDLNKVASIALIHDLPESLTSDIPLAFTQLGGEGTSRIKKEVEKEAISHIAQNSYKKWFQTIWLDLEKQESIESKIVAGADILDMLIHAVALEKSGVAPEILDQFFLTSQQRIDQLKIMIIKDIFWELYREHCEIAERMKSGIQKISRVD